MILYAPFAIHAYTHSLLNLQGDQYDNCLLQYKENKVFAYKNGVDCSKEFLEKYNKNLIDCMPKIEFLPYDECKCICDPENEHFKDFKEFLKNIDNSKISVISSPIDITCLKFVLSHCQVYNIVVNPYVLLTYFLSTYDYNGKFDLEFLFNYFDVCLELKKRGYACKQIAWKDFRLFNENTQGFNPENVENIFKEKSLNICKNYYDYNNRKVNILKAFGF